MANVSLSHQLNITDTTLGALLGDITREQALEMVKYIAVVVVVIIFGISDLLSKKPVIFNIPTVTNPLTTQLGLESDLQKGPTGLTGHLTSTESSLTGKSQGSALTDNSPHVEVVRRSPPYVGLANEGNTCYLNSIVNYFLHIAEVGAALATADDILASGYLKLEIRRTFKKLLRLNDWMDGTRKVTVHILGLMGVFGVIPHGEQNDAAELLIQVSDSIKAMIPEQYRLLEFTQLETVETIDANFRPSRTETTRRILSCTMIELPVPARAKKTSLQALLSRYTSVEHPNRGVGKTCNKKTMIGSLPEYLTLLIKRTLFKDGAPYKSPAEISYPFELDIRNRVADGVPGPYLYILHSIIVHDGLAAGRGHYYYIFREDIEDGRHRWIKLDDDIVTILNRDADAMDAYFGGYAKHKIVGASREAHRLPATAYILVYERLPAVAPQEHVGVGLRRRTKNTEETII